MTTAAIYQDGLAALTVNNPRAEVEQLGSSALTVNNPRAEVEQLGVMAFVTYYPNDLVHQNGIMALTVNNPRAEIEQMGAAALTVNNPQAQIYNAGIIAFVSYIQGPPPGAPLVSSGRKALFLTASDFLAAFQRLMPRGPIWPRDLDATQTQVLSALQPTYVRSTNAANALLVDAFPATAVNLLPEWENTLGLPDPCAGIDPLISDRQAHVVARLTSRGGNMSQDYYTSFAKKLGYDITITQYAPFRAGVSRAGQPAYGEDWAFVWQVNAPSFTINYFCAGDAAGEPLATWGSTALQCELQRIAPAHTTLIFSYSEE